jgi:hypothetical protein
MASIIRNGSVVLAKPLFSFYVRLPIDPADAASIDDKFELTSSDGSYRQVKTIRDDLIAGDRYVDLLFTKMRPDAKYSLQIDPGKEGDPYFLFKDIAYPKLATLFGRDDVDIEQLDTEAVDEREGGEQESELEPEYQPVGSGHGG